MQNQVVAQNLKESSLSLKQSSKRKLSLFDESDLHTESKRNSIKFQLKLQAVQIAADQLIHTIQILRNNNEDRLGKYIFLKCENGIFSWMYEDWLNTLAKRIIWFDKLEREMKPGLFESWVTSKNYKAFEGVIEAITKAYSEGKQTLMDVMNSIVRLNNIEDELQEEFKRGSLIEEETKAKLLALKYVKKGFTKLPQRPEDSLLIEVIKNRYLVRYSKVKEEEAELRTQHAENRLIQEMERYNKLLSTEQFASSCTRDTYFNQIANYCLRIEQFEARYDVECARLDNEHSYLKLSMEKIAVNMVYLKDQLDWYRHMMETPPEKDSRSGSKSARSSADRRSHLGSRKHTMTGVVAAKPTSVISNKRNKTVQRTRAKRRSTLSSKSQNENSENLDKDNQNQI